MIACKSLNFVILVILLEFMTYLLNYNSDSHPPKIHLLVSVYLTDVSLNPPNFYGKKISPSQNKVEQFLSTLHSLEKIKFHSAQIYVELAEPYRSNKEVIKNQINKFIPHATIHFKRLEFFDDWVEASNKIPQETELVLLKANHDHVFVPKDADNFYSFLHDLLSYGSDFYGEITHWPESIGNLRSGKWELSPNSRSRNFVSNATMAIGTCIISPIFFKSWWFRDFTSGSKIVRPDNPFGPWVQFKSVKRVVPPTEYFRHLDGYGHANVNAPIAAPLKPCCVLHNEQAIHTDWNRGNYLLSHMKIDLPLYPTKKLVNSFSTLINQALLASAYKVNLKNLYYVSKAFKYKGGKFAIIGLALCLTNWYFLMKLLNQLLPVSSGNAIMYKYRFLPPSIKELIFLKFNNKK
jgi:hypothetical protein